MKTIRAHEMRPDTFAPFGDLIETPSGKAEVEKEYLTYWQGMYTASIGISPTLGYLRILKRPAIITMLERHLKHEEIFICVKGLGIMAFALPTKEDVPSPTDVVAFKVRPGTGFLIRRGVWHVPGIAIDSTLEFLLALPPTILSDIDERPVEEFRIKT